MRTSGVGGGVPRRPRWASLRRRSSGDPSRSRGAALVELSVAIPVLVLIAFGVIEFGTVYDQKIELNQAVRDGARTASTGSYAQYGCADGDVVCVVGEASDDTPPDAVGVVVAGGNVVVCAEKAIESVTPVIGSFLDGKSVHAEVTMRIEDDSATIAASGSCA